MRDLGPLRPGGQGLDWNQEESGNRAIAALLRDAPVRDQVDLVITWRAGRGGEPGAYEVWSRRGMIRFRRCLTAEGRFEYPIVEQIGANPIACQDPFALATLEEERKAAEASGFDPDDPKRRFVAPEHQSYPFAYERIAQLFDSPCAPDLAVSPLDWTQGIQRGTHGALHVRQSRAPLWLAGPRARPGLHRLAIRSVDLAPTLLAALGFPRIDGADASGRRASERGVEADVLLRWQDGRVVAELLDLTAPPPRRLYLFVLDGLHATELEEQLARRPEALPHLRRLRERAARLAGGSIVCFPSITWPSHTTIATGAWPGHHDVVNPTYYLRDRRETVSPQGQQIRTEGYVSTRVETLYEAFARVFGPGCATAAIYAPVGRGAEHAVLEGRNLCDRARLRALNLELAADCDPRWEHEGFDAVRRESILDTRGVAQVLELFERDDPPRLVYHELALTDGVGHDYGPHGEGIEAALAECDRRIGRVLAAIERRGLTGETLFVLTSDHGMAPQDVALRANPARHVERIGMECVVAEPMIWLRDLRLELERAADGRTARIQVCDNDALPNGEHPPVGGARVVVEWRARGEGRPRRIAEGKTDAEGFFAFGTPMDAESDEIALVVSAAGFNRRHLRLDGTNLAIDPRELLGGAS